MSLLNPFNRQPSPTEMAKEERKFVHEENVFSNAAHPQATDEQIHLDEQNKRADLIMWQQDLGPEIDLLIHDIRREYYTKDGEWMRIPGMNPLANEIFIQDLVALVRPSLSKNLMMSNYTEERILKVLMSTVWDLRVHLLQNRMKYNIQKTDMNLIVRLFKNTIEATYFRSLHDGERRHLSTIGKRIETHNFTPEQEKKGIFGIGG